jgi:hypothetical protein
MLNTIYKNNVHRGVKKTFRFKFTQNVNKDRITKVIENAIAEHNAKIDIDAVNTALIATNIAKTAAIKAIVMVDKFLAVTYTSTCISTFKNDENYRATIVRLKANEALAVSDAILALTLAKQAAINATETTDIAKTAAMALEANIALSANIVVDVESNT